MSNDDASRSATYGDIAKGLRFLVKERRLVQIGVVDNELLAAAEALESLQSETGLPINVAPQGTEPSVDSSGSAEPATARPAAATPTPVEFVADSEREGMPETGIFVRAKLNGRFEAVDVAMLTGSSLLAWMRSRGGRNHYAENFALHLLGHAMNAQETP